MGFAAGVRAGSDLVGDVWRENRAREQDVRVAKEFGWKEKDRAEEESIRAQERTLRDQALALYKDQPPAGLDVPPAQQIAAPGAAAPVADVAQGAAGQRAGTAQGMPTQPVGAPQPAVPVAPGASAGAIAGTATAPTPVEQATPNAPPAAAPQRQLGREQMLERNAEQLAILRGNQVARRQAQEAGRASGVREILDTKTKEFMALSDDEKSKLAYSPNLTGDIPMVTLAHDKNGMTVVPIDPKTGQPVDSKKPIHLSWADAAQLHAASEMAKQGYGAEAIDHVTKVNAKIGEAVKEHNKLQLDIAGKNTEAAYKGGSLEVQRGTLAEHIRHDKATEADRAETQKLAKDKAKLENNQITAVGPDGITYFDTKSGDVGTTPWAKGTTDEQKKAVMAKFKTREDPKLSADGQFMTVGQTVYQANPDFKADPKKVGINVNVTDKWLDVTPGKMSATEAALAKLTGGDQGGPAGAPAPAAPKQGMPVPAAQQRPVAAAPAAPAGPARDPLMAALNTSGNPTLDTTLAPKADAIKQAAGAMAQIQRQMQQASATGNQGVLRQAAQAFSQAEGQLNSILRDMNPDAAAQVRNAALRQAGLM